MYKPNFILVGGISNKAKELEKEVLANHQLEGNYDLIIDSLMKQFTEIDKENNNEKDSKVFNNVLL